MQDAIEEKVGGMTPSVNGEILDCLNRDPSQYAAYWEFIARWWWGKIKQDCHGVKPNGKGQEYITLQELSYNHIMTIDHILDLQSFSGQDKWMWMENNSGSPQQCSDWAKARGSENETQISQSCEKNRSVNKTWFTFWFMFSFSSLQPLHFKQNESQ